MFLISSRIKIDKPPFWVVIALIALAVSISAAWYLYPAPKEFSLDDAYIHLVYAKNLAETGRWFFNNPGERAVGTTSPLWVTLLAAGLNTGIPLHISAKVLGIISLIIIWLRNLSSFETGSSMAGSLI